MTEELPANRLMTIVLAVALVTGLYAFFGGLAVGIFLSDSGIFTFESHPLPRPILHGLILIIPAVVTLASMEEVSDALAIIRRGVEEREQ